MFVLKGTDEFSNTNCILAAQGEQTKPIIQFSFQELSGKNSAKLRKKPPDLDLSVFLKASIFTASYLGIKC